MDNKMAISPEIKEINKNINHQSLPTSKGESNLPVSSENVNQNEFKIYNQRWIGMLVIIFLNIITSFVWLSFNSVSKISQKWFNSSLSEVNLSVLIYLLGSLLMNSFSGFVFEKWGIKAALITGGTLNLVGTWIRYFGSFIESSEESHQSRLVIVLIGQLIASMAQGFFLNASPKYSMTWFSDSSRTIATTIGTVANPLGAAIAMVFIPAICKEPKDMPFMLLVIAVLSLVAIIPAFFISSRPETPPSVSASIAESTKLSFWTGLKRVSKNGQFWILCVSFGVYVAIFNMITSLINQIVAPYGYSDNEAGLFGACFISAGIVGSGIAGVYVDKTKQYKPVLKFSTPLLAAGYIAFVFAVQEERFLSICFLCAFLGFVSFALLPIALELGIEATYPCPPCTSTSLLWLAAQILGIIFLPIADSLRNSSPFADEPKDTMRTGLIVIACVATLTTFSSLGFTSPYYRMEAESKNKNCSSNTKA